MGVFLRNKFYLVLTTLFVCVLFLFITEPKQNLYVEVPLPLTNVEIRTRGLSHRKIEEWWALRNTSSYSTLGEVLFLGKPQPPAKDQKFQILVWKYGPTIENRHLKQFSGQKRDTFEHCPVNNCAITYDDSDVETADIVLFHLHRIKGVDDLPLTRNPNQIWAFLTDESPYHTFLNSKNKLEDFNGIFNWSMSYRMDTDIPVPYGRTVLKTSNDTTTETPLVLNKREDVLVAILGSNCGGINNRWSYVKELQKYIKVDVYGHCGPLKTECPGHFATDCPSINNYMFYLSFENSNCDEYITEKLWWNAFEKKAIPIVMGSSMETYKKILPVDSYINVDEFAKPQHLAQYLIRLMETGEYRIYHRWRNYFDVLNEHGYFKSKSYHYCRVCQALNYNSREEKVYEDLKNYWSVSRDCHPAWDSWIE